MVCVIRCQKKRETNRLEGLFRRAGERTMASVAQLPMAEPAPKTPAAKGQRAVALRIWRGDPQGGKFEEYRTEVGEGMVVLAAVHRVQAQDANDLAVRWNCKAGKCGSCSAEINGKPALMCMTQLAHLPLEQPITLEPLRAFP